MIVNLITQMEAGGAQGAAVRLTKEFNNRGIKSETWFLHVKRPVYMNETNTRIIYRKKGNIFLSIFIIFKLIFFFKKYKPNVVICYTHYANIIGTVCAFLTGIPVRIVTQRNPSFSYPSLAKVLDRLLGSSKIYSHNICVSTHVFDSFKNYNYRYKRKLKVVYNGIDYNSSNLSKIQARKIWNLPKDKFIIATTGRLSKQKNHNLIIDVLSELSDKFIFAIAGEGELRSNIEKQVKDLDLENKVVLLGEISPMQIPDFLKSADLFVFPSKFEAFGFSLVEAMASGLPVVASDIPALRHILDGNGFNVDIDNKSGWKESIMFFYNSEMHVDAYSKMSINRSKSFTLKNMADGYLQLINSPQN